MCSGQPPCCPGEGNATNEPAWPAAMTPHDDGPTLQTYVETRFNLLTESLKDLAAAQSGALGAAIEGLKSTQQAADLRYQQRFEAQSNAVTAALQAATEATQAALMAVKEQTKSAFEASEKAIEKSDANAEKWRANANEWRQAMVDRESRFASRAETETEFRALRTEIAGLKESRDVGSGRGAGVQTVKDDTRNYLMAGVSILFFLLALATFIYARFN